MTPRERFLAAVRNEVPDRVPVAPDTSNYIPAKRTGLPFWDIYFKREIPLWRAYLDTVDWLGTEAWVASCMIPPVTFESEDVELTVTDELDDVQDAMLRHSTWRTPDGELTATSLCFRHDPPSPVDRPIKDFEKDWPAFRRLLTMPEALNESLVDEMRSECAKRDQAFGLCITYPGFHNWEQHVQGGIEALTYALMDYPHYLDEWFDRNMETGTRLAELIIEAKPDYVLLGGSGTVTMASPELAKRYAIPAIARWTKMFKDAGIATMLHSCGKSRALVDMLVEDTDLNSFNPLELAPMGDADLAEVKRARGAEIGLMGNLHTTNVMLHGSATQVREAAIEAMRAAGEGGGFILSTGDQCPLDTPDENLFAMLEVAREYGEYDAEGRLPNLPAPAAA